MGNNCKTCVRNKLIIIGGLMIGQEQLQDKIDKMLSNYPKFSIIVGAKGSGKRTIAKSICRKLGLKVAKFGTSIEEVRQVIELSYEQIEPICYLCADADTMSLGAKNALLKITEEPPNNAYFILTLQSLSNTLETIKSRGVVLTLDEYSKEELIEYRKTKSKSDFFDKIITEVCSTTGEVSEIMQYDIPAFYRFAETTAFVISEINSGNVFKIPKHLKLTVADDDGYEPTLLFKAVRQLYIKKAKETNDRRYLLASIVTSQCLQDLSLQTVSKLGTVDKWIMDVRSVLRS